MGAKEQSGRTWPSIFWARGTVRKVIIFLNISRHSLLICLHCCLHPYKTLKAVAMATAAIVVLTPAKNLKFILGFLVVSPLFNHFLG